MKRNIKSNAVIRAIMSATAGMMTITTTVGAIPMQVFAEELESNEDVENAVTTVTVSADNENDIITDGEGHKITVETEKKELYKVGDAEPTEDASKAADKVLDYTTVDTVAKVESEHIVVDTKTGENVVGYTADGQEVSEIKVDSETVIAEQVDVIKSVDEDGKVIGYTEFDAKGLVYYHKDATTGEVTELSADRYADLSDDEKAKYTAYVKDATGNYAETTSITTYVNTEDERIYLTDNYDASKLEVKDIYTVKDTDIVVSKENVQEVAKEDGTTEYQVKLNSETKTVYTNQKEVYKLVNGDFIELAIGTVTVASDSIEVQFDTQQAIGQQYGSFTDINGDIYYAKVGATETNDRILKVNTDSTTVYYYNDVNNNKIEVPSGSVSTNVTYNVSYDGTTLASGLTEAEKEEFISNIKTHKYTAIDKNTYVIEVPGEGDGEAKKIYLTTDKLEVLTSHKVTFTETTTYYYVDSLKKANASSTKDKTAGIVIDGKEYLVKVILENRSKVGVKTDGIKYDVVYDEEGNATAVKVSLEYKINDGTYQPYTQIIPIDEFGPSHIVELNLASDAVVIRTGNESVTFTNDNNAASEYTMNAVNAGNATTGGALAGIVTAKNLIVKSYIRYDTIEQIEDGSTTHYATKEYTGAQSVYYLEYNAKGYNVYALRDGDNKLTGEFHTDMGESSDYADIEAAINKYLSSVQYAEGNRSLQQVSDDYVGTPEVKTAIEKKINEVVDAKVAEMKAAILAQLREENPDLSEDDVNWTLSDEDIQAIKDEAIAKTKVHWYVLKYESDNYHIDGVVMLDSITIDLNGTVDEIPAEPIPTPPVPTPTPEPTPVPTPEPTPVPTPEPTPVPTPGPVVTPDVTPVFAAAPVAAPAPVAVLGANRTEETTEATATDGAVLGERRENGGAVLGARRGATTGDTTNFGMYVAILGAAAFAGAGYTALRRKEEEEA